MPVIPLSLNAPHQIMGHSHPNSSIPMPPKLSLPTSHNSTTVFGITQWMPNKVNTIDHKSKARGQWLRRWSIDSPFLLHIQHQSKIRTFCFLRLSREDLIYWHSPEERYFDLGLVQHCKKWGEFMDHLLLYCPIALELWTMAFSLFGLHWAMPKRVIDMFAAWQGSFGKHRT